MKTEKYLGWIAAIFTVVTFFDQYLLNSIILNNLKIPESIPTSIFFMVLALVCFTFFFASRSRLTIPYPDQGKEVDSLNDKLQSYEVRIKELSNQNEELLSLKNIFDGDEYLQNKILGILLKGDISSEGLMRELGINSGEKYAVANFQAVIGRMSKQGLVSATSLGYYKLSKNAY